jgi:hypothetical protein
MAGANSGKMVMARIALVFIRVLEDVEYLRPAEVFRHAGHEVAPLGRNPE